MAEGVLNMTQPVLAEAHGLNIRSQRIASIDLLRGVIMIVMALDHVRDYFHWSAMYYDPLDPAMTTPAIYFTRWVTHFCAPNFMFLAGASAFLMGLRKTKKQLSFFLLTRGLWLMLMELTLINLAWSFNPSFPGFPLITIWALGTIMVVLSALVWLPFQAILAIGLIIVFGHNLLDGIHVPGHDLKAFLWAELHDPTLFQIGGKGLWTGYPVLSWIGVGCLGYSFGKLFTPEFGPVRRKRILLWLGGGAIALFIVLRYMNVYGDPLPWAVQKTSLQTFFSFMDVQKYPPSLLYTLATLGPAMLFLAFAEGPVSKFGKKIITIGRVPFFYYILHIYLIHALALVAAEYSGFDWRDMIVKGGFINVPGYGFSLWAVYLVWIAVVLALYPLCKWYDTYKTTHKEQWWLSYL
jgi:uncharacterized membrane protein